MAQIIIVSNRLPISVKKEADKLIYSIPTGGLISALTPFIKERRNKWIGWPGIAADELTESERKAITREFAKQNCLPVFLTQKQVDDFYSGYSNSLLWPMFHNLPLDDGTSHARWWHAYKEVNQLYADAVLQIAQAKSTVWVQDYQLLLLPETLRSHLHNSHIGFFMHIPFPSMKFLEKLPESKRLIKGMLGAELIGFHTSGYVKNFLAACQEYGLGAPGDDQLIVGARTIQVTDFPLGIDYEKFANARKLPAVKKAVREYKSKYKGLKIIASADRLDISKGFVERLQAYQQFLEQNPKQIGKVVFVLVGAPSRTDVVAYQKLGEQVSTLAMEINQRFGTTKWKPVDYINESIPFENVSALFQVADVAFIAPLRDGMNLTAKEFVATNRQKGVLILSQTAGAADELHDALLVNPRKPASSVAALQQALAMPKQQLRKRLSTMRKQVETNTVHTWAKAFVGTLQEPLVKPLQRTKSLRPSVDSIARRYRQKL